MNMIWISHEHKRPFTSIASIVRARYQFQTTPSNWYTTHPLYTINTNHIWLTFSFFSFSLLPSSSLVIVVHWFCFVSLRFLCSQRNYIVDLLRVLLNWDLPKHVLLPLEATDNLSRLLADPILGNDCLTVQIIYNWYWLLLLLMLLVVVAAMVVISFSSRINNVVNVGTSVFVSNFLFPIVVLFPNTWFSSLFFSRLV